MRHRAGRSFRTDRLVRNMRAEARAVNDNDQNPEYRIKGRVIRKRGR